jgi:glycine/D-amino acid oxidase-like deaminating enzyme/nitrite reductase/ring-hydroxylating ferredoxin subunit
VTSLWLDHADLPTFDTVQEPAQYDVVVVGAGLTGLVTALLLVRAGLSVAVVEGRRIGSGTTGNTTAKISLLQGTRLSTLATKNPLKTVRAYVDANREGKEWLLRYCDDHGIDVQKRPAFTYATTAQGEKQARAELATAEAAGLDVRWDSHLELPYATRGAVRLDDQAQFDPVAALSALVLDVQAHGGVVFERTRVRTVRQAAGRCTVVTEHGDLEASQVVLATGIPILDRGGYFGRLEPLRSYAAAFSVPQALPEGMYLSADSPTRSLRSAFDRGDELLLVGGNGHVVGRHRSPASLVDDLTRWTELAFPGARRTHWWSAQDYESLDGLPYVGPLLPRHGRIFVATGYDKWGMTTGVAAALALSSQLLGGNTPWSTDLRSWRLRELSGLGRAVKLNSSVAARMAQGWVRVALASDHSPESLEEGHGRVERRGTSPVAVCTVAGETHEVSAVCPHLKGVVTWNDAELSWDCPLHGSRFSADGAVLEGPATVGLTPR